MLLRQPRTVLVPQLTDLVALLGIDLVLCAGALRLFGGRRRAASVAKWGVAVCFVLLWFPAGAANLPLLGLVRGISSDLSITLVTLACLDLCQRLQGFPAVASQEKRRVYGVIAMAALLLYPMALGWGDWDTYRFGWGSWGLWTALLALSLFSWLKGWRLVPMLVGLSLLAWSAGLMESGNLWDYLLDPWLALVSFFYCLKSGWRLLLTRFNQTGRSSGKFLH